MSSTKMLHVFMFGAAILVAAGAPAIAQDNPFGGLSGNWSGSGTIKMADGNNERIRCRAAYAVKDGGVVLTQDLRCASDSYKFELNSAVSYSAGAVNGTWTETTRQVSGSISGRAAGGQIQVHAQSPGFSANLSVATRGNSQAVTIQPTSGDVSLVNITMTRGGG